MKDGLEKTVVWKDFIESPVGIAINGYMNTVPGFNGAWVALQQAIEQSKNMRILRALDLLELFSDTKFQEEFLQSEQAIDCFGLCFEAIIKERNKEKRKTIKNIFLGFTKLSEKEKEKFELEKLLDITNKVSIEEIKLLITIKDRKIKNIPYEELLFKMSLTKHSAHDYHKNNKKLKNKINGLEKLGIIFLNKESINPLKDSFNENNNTIKIKESIEISLLGEKFISYILKNES